MIELSVAPAPPAAAPEHDASGALPWRSLEEGIREAAERRMPVLCLAEHPWSNSAQRLALFLRHDSELADRAANAFVPLLVNPADRPDIVDLILNAAHRLEPDVSPPLLAVLTEEGLPLVTFCHLALEGTPDRPSLLALLTAAEAHYRADREACLQEARALAGQPAGEARSCFLPAYALWRDPRSDTIDRLLRAGIHDQLAGGFHRAARGPDMGVPHFEKTAVQNAAMAAVLGRAGRPEAEQAARFALHALEAGSSGLASDTAYYTWSSDEILEALPPDELQMAGLHFRITAAGSRHVLNQVVLPEDAAAAATGQTADEALYALGNAKARLLAVRQQRRSPASLPAPEPAAELYTLSWLVQASAWLPWLPAATLKDRILELTAGEIVRSDGSRWLHDQVAAVAALRSIGDEAAAGQLLRETEQAYLVAGEWRNQPDREHVCTGWHDHALPGVLRELREFRRP